LTADQTHILLLAGTFEARVLVNKLLERFPTVRLTASFAGAVKDLPDLSVPTRIGGFGGVEGLCQYLQTEKVSLIIDATHPFAAQMSRNAFHAAEREGVAILRLERPAWQQAPNDLWHPVASMDDAADAIPDGAHAFLAAGRKEIATFYRRGDIIGTARMIEPPPAPLPDHWSLVLSRPPQSAEEEVEQFQEKGITHVVTKNSGGTRAYAKIEAARQMQLPVIIVDRPELPSTDTAATVNDVLDWTDKFLNT
jgi:precorrin-6A/cobalt-precorrin-6A reductase